MKKTMIVLLNFLIIFSLILFSSNVGSFPVVSGASMEPTYHDGDVLYLDKLAYKEVGGIERFDVVVAREQRILVIKRVIALPGERISIKEGKVFVNGEILDESYGKELIEKNFGEITVPEGHLFVLGDNRNNSCDSREFGAIKFENVMGKVSKVLIASKER